MHSAAPSLRRFKEAKPVIPGRPEPVSEVPRADGCKVRDA
jgi:hypothetical protein